MKKYYLAASLLMAIGLFGCTSDDEVLHSSLQEQTPGKAISIQNVTFKASFPGEEIGTRTSVQSNGVVSWTKGDKLTFFVRPSGETVDDWEQKGYVHTFMFDDQDPSNQMFRHDANCACKDHPEFLLEAGKSYDWYVSYHCEGTKSPFQVTPKFTNTFGIASDGTTLAKDVYLPMSARIENHVWQANTNSIPSVKLEHLNTLMVLSLKNRTGADLNMKSVRVEVPGEHLNAKVTLNLQNGIMTPMAPTDQPVADTESTLVLEAAEGLAFNYENGDAYEIYFPCLPFVLQPDHAMNVTVTDDAGVTHIFTKKVEKAKTFASGKRCRTCVYVGNQAPSKKEEVEIPNKPFENILLKESVSPLGKVDQNNDGKLTYEEVSAVKTIKIEFSKITTLSRAGVDDTDTKMTSLEGIENFPNLEELYVKGDRNTVGPLTRIDVSKNPKLKVLECQYNQINSLNLIGNPLLTRLNCLRNQLTDLDVSTNKNLETLLCAANKLTALNINGLNALRYVSCSSNLIASMDVSNLDHLESFEGSNNKLTSLNLKNCKNLESLSCQNNQLQNLDLTSLPNLDILYCDKNKLGYLNVDNNPLLSNLHCSENHINELNLSKNPNLTKIDCGGNNINMLYVQDKSKLQDLICDKCNLVTLKITNCPEIKSLICNDNQLWDFVLPELTKLTYLRCSNNPNIRTLDISKSSILERVFLSNTGLTSLDVSNLPNLDNLYLDNNKLTTIDVSHNLNLYALKLSYNPISMLDLQNNKNLGTLTLSNCKDLTSLDLSANTQLVKLYVDGVSRLGEFLDISKNKTLQELNTENSCIRQIIVWDSFDLNNPPAKFKKDAQAQYVYPGIVMPDYGDGEKW